MISLVISSHLLSYFNKLKIHKPVNLHLICKENWHYEIGNKLDWLGQNFVQSFSQVSDVSHSHHFHWPKLNLTQSPPSISS